MTRWGNLAGWTGALVLSVLVHAGALFAIQSLKAEQPAGFGTARDSELVVSTASLAAPEAAPTLPGADAEEAGEAADADTVTADDGPVAEAVEATIVDEPATDASAAEIAAAAQPPVATDEAAPEEAAEPPAADEAATGAPEDAVPAAPSPVTAATAEVAVAGAPVPDEAAAVTPENPDAAEEVAVLAAQPPAETVAARSFVPPLPRDKPLRPIPQKPIQQVEKTIQGAPRRSASQRSGQRTARAGQATGEAAAPRAGSSGPAGGAEARQAARRYGAQVRAWIERHKRYPAEARARGVEGVVRIAATIDGNGRVTSYRIVASSGHKVLDAEVDALMRRASPFPKPPAELGRFAFAVPIAFEIR